MAIAELARSIVDDDPEFRYQEHGRADYPESDHEDPSDYARYTRELWDEQEAALEPLHRVWIQNILFLAGHQWWTYDQRRGTWGPPKTAPWKEHPVANLTLPFFKHFLAKVTKQRPAWTAIAGSVEPSDMHAAKLADEALEAKWQELRMGRVLRRAIAWVIATGNAYLLPYWNTETGVLRPLTVPVLAQRVDTATGEVTMEEVECPCDENGEPFMTEGPDGTPIYDLEREPIYVDQGDLGCRVYSPFQVRVDPHAECDEDVSFVIIAEVMPVRDIKRRWKERAADVGAEEVGIISEFDNMVHGLATAGADTHVVGGSNARDEELPKAMVLHYHEKQSPDYPKGRYWVTCGDHLLEDPGPLPDDLWPVVTHLGDVEVPGRYHYASTLESIVGLNREYNEVNAAIKEHHNLLLRGKWLVPIGSKIRAGTITTQPGEVIQHTPGLAPKMADLKPLPAPVYAERDRIKADFQLISGLNRISMGEPPPGVTSGTAFLTLQEADDTDLGPFLAMLEESVAEVAWAFLQLMQHNYTDERLITILGDDRRYTVKAFKGADLSGVIDVRPQAESSFPWSRTARQSLLLDLLGRPAGMELFRDEETGMFDKSKVARLLPIAGLDAVTSYEDIDMNEAHREHEAFAEFTGEPDYPLPQLTPWQNLAVHLREHTRVLKSAEFEQWPEEAKAAFIVHWEQTRQAIALQQAQAAQTAMQMQQAAQSRDPEDDDGEPEEIENL